MQIVWSLSCLSDTVLAVLLWHGDFDFFFQILTIVCLYGQDIKNPFWVPVRVCIPKITSTSEWFCGIQIHEGERRSAWVPMIDTISFTMFFSCDNFPCDYKNVGNHSQIVANHSQRLEITAECGRNRLSFVNSKLDIMIFLLLSLLNCEWYWIILDHLIMELTVEFLYRIRDRHNSLSS